MAALPTHETLPADHKAAIRQMKQALRAQIGDVQAVFDKLSARISERLDEINALKATGQEVWPTIPFSDIAEGKVSDENAYIGRTYRDAPDVDGYIFINTDEELMTGDIVRARVTGAYEYDLIGELL